MMEDNLQQALTQKLLAMGDDELILGHRNSEWTGHAPILEEDIAIANIAQDELGHAGIWYGLHGELTGSDPDQLAFFRDVNDFRCCQLVSLPKGDWAFTIVRQYLFDAYEALFLAELKESRYQPLADASHKIYKEEIYHRRHSQAWVKRLGLGTEESHRRTKTALHTLWSYALQLFVPLPTEPLLVEAHYVPDIQSVGEKWQAQVVPFLEGAGLQVPAITIPITNKRAVHSQHLVDVLLEMQGVARLHPNATW